MCGITGFWTPGGFALADARQTLETMTRRLRTRGPDGQGLWLDDAAGIAMGHRRLAVLDLSPAGRQPMQSSCGRYVVVFNGEIYNHDELRHSLDRTNWRGHSDTETLLEAITTWGLSKTLEKSVGMFALALWDRHTRTLSLARDRVGEKPLYYGWHQGSFLFGSELKALREHPQFDRGVDRSALGSLIRKGFISAPLSIYQGVKKLLPGTFVRLEATDVGTTPSVQQYWSLAEVVARGLDSPFAGGPKDAVDELERLLKDAVTRQLVSDVPLGAFLSGGIDSSAVVATMQAISQHPVKTYCIGFADPDYNEADHARAVAQHLGTDHTEYVATPDDALKLIPILPEVYDEPFADMSQIPTLLVSGLARRSVTVALSGDGGDELFAGYGRYQQALAAWHKLEKIPLVLRRLLKPFLPPGVIKAGIDTPDVDSFYAFINTQWKTSPGLVLNEQRLTVPPDYPAGLNPISRMMFSDTLDYLPDDILVKVDRAAMFHSLETRVPLLDHRLVEFAWTLPFDLKHRENTGKWVLKELAYRYVPRQLLDRKKRGFAVPMNRWLRYELRDWAEDMLSLARLSRHGYLDKITVRREWAAHLNGTKENHYGLWAVLMFQQWLAENP